MVSAVVVMAFDENGKPILSKEESPSAREHIIY
jgi:hypothetical protein